MNSSRCSKLGTVLLVAVLAVAFVGPATAITVDSEDAPTEAEVGSEVSASYQMSELFQNPTYEQWRLNGTTELTGSPTWQLELVNNQGNVMETEQKVGQNVTFETTLDASQPIAEVRVTVTGDVPGLGNYTYEDRPSFAVTTLSQVPVAGSDQGNPKAIDTWTANQYTADSQAARQAIEAAQAAIDSASDAGASTGDAEEDLQAAKEFYTGGDFENAINQAENAEEEANSAKNSAESTQQRNNLLLMAGGVLVLLLLVGGGLYWYSQQGDDYDKLG